MGILSWVIAGLVAGWLASLVMKGRGYGVLGDIILGVIGAVVGGFLAGALFGYQDVAGQFYFGTLIVAFVGAVFVILVIRLLPPRQSF